MQSQTRLFESLQAAIPLWMVKLQGEGGITKETWPHLQEKLQHLDFYLERCDEYLISRGKKTTPDEAATAFNALAEGLAILSFLPGGITFGGTHYDAQKFLQLG